MITKAGFTFKLKSNPRTKDGGFGPERCTICKSKTTMLLQIADSGNHEYNSALTLCKGCLSWMIELIDKGMIDEIKKEGIAREITSYILTTANTESLTRTLMGQGV